MYRHFKWIKDPFALSEKSRLLISDEEMWSNLFDLLTVQCCCTRWSLIDSKRRRIRYVCAFRVWTNVWTEQASSRSRERGRGRGRGEREKMRLVLIIRIVFSLSLSLSLAREMLSCLLEWARSTRENEWERCLTLLGRNEKFRFFCFVLKAESFKHQLNANRWQTTFLRLNTKRMTRAGLCISAFSFLF